jgi:hypothetical protein
MIAVSTTVWWSLRWYSSKVGTPPLAKASAVLVFTLMAAAAAATEWN